MLKRKSTPFRCEYPHKTEEARQLKSMVGLLLAIITDVSPLMRPTVEKDYVRIINKAYKRLKPPSRRRSSSGGSQRQGPDSGNSGNGNSGNGNSGNGPGDNSQGPFGGPGNSGNGPGGNSQGPFGGPPGGHGGGYGHGGGSYPGPSTNNHSHHGSGGFNGGAAGGGHWAAQLGSNPYLDDDSASQSSESDCSSVSTCYMDSDDESVKDFELSASIKANQVMARIFQGGIVDLEEKDQEGWTALHRVSSYGHCYFVGFLLDKGADPYAKTNSGETPLDIAKSREMVKAAELLKKAMTKQPNPGRVTPNSKHPFRQVTVDPDAHCDIEESTRRVTRPFVVPTPPNHVTPEREVAHCSTGSPDPPTSQILPSQMENALDDGLGAGEMEQLTDSEMAEQETQPVSSVHTTEEDKRILRLTESDVSSNTEEIPEATCLPASTARATELTVSENDATTTEDLPVAHASPSDSGELARVVSAASQLLSSLDRISSNLSEEVAALHLQRQERDGFKKAISGLLKQDPPGNSLDTSLEGQSHRRQTTSKRRGRKVRSRIKRVFHRLESIYRSH